MQLFFSNKQCMRYCKQKQRKYWAELSLTEHRDQSTHCIVMEEAFLVIEELFSNFSNSFVHQVLNFFLKCMVWCL